MSRREGSALEDFFGDFVPMLHSAVREDNAIFAEDPTIDLDRMEVAMIPQPQPQPSKHHSHTTNKQQQPQQKQRSSLPARPALQRQSSTNSQQVKKVTNQTFQVPEKRDCSMDELNVIVEQLKSENSYSQKLLAIMLDGLERTLSSNYYRFFIDYGLPSNWIPLVKMNNDNTPFVEFLVKSDLSDQDPFSQLKEYSADQMALCAFVLNHLQKSARKKQLVPANNNNNNIHKSNQAQQQQAQQKQPQQRPPQPLQIKASKHGHSIVRPEHAPQPPKKQVLADKNQRSSLPIMTTSTPIKSQAAAMAKRSLMPPRLSVDAALNDSKRILPFRACKANTSGMSYRC